MSRQRYQRGTLKSFVPGKKGKPKRQLARGHFWARWYRYLKSADGSERRSPREKIITKQVARTVGIETDYVGPLTKTDAQKVLDLLIQRDAGTYTPPDTTLTLGQIARDYLATAEPGWGAHTARTSKGIIEYALIGGKLGSRPVLELTEIDLQQFLNEHVASGASRSKLSKLLLYLRNILDHALMKKIIASNPARNPGYKLKAKSRKAVSQRYLSIEECRRLMAAVDGSHRLIFRILIQLGLRPEELFALRVGDVVGDMLRIDEAIVEGEASTVKTEASEASVFIPPDLLADLRALLQQRKSDASDWLFPSPKGHPWGLQNYLNRVLKPAALRARVGVFIRTTRNGGQIESTDVNFQALRRTCGTLFGAKAKDPRDTQAQLRHADPTVTLRHYQKSIPASVRIAAVALEAELLGLKQSKYSERVLNRAILKEKS